jgi:hypothetical protein
MNSQQLADRQIVTIAVECEPRKTRPLTWYEAIRLRDLAAGRGDRREARHYERMAMEAA